MSSNSAIQVKSIRSATGPAVKAGDEVAVFYTGVLASDGTVFDRNFDFTNYVPIPGSQPFTFVLGSGSVIQGWDQGLPGLHLGQIVELTFPPELGYGAQGSPPAIPGNASLTFQVELLGVKPQGQTDWIVGSFTDIGISSKLAKVAGALGQNAQSTKIGTDAGDQIVGTDQADLLIGLLGDDIIIGAGGADGLLGGSGSNRFVYTSLNDSPAQKGASDTVVGFSTKARDRIDLSALPGTKRFIGRKTFSGVAGEVRFQSGSLQLDADGDKSADLAVLLPGVSRFTAGSLLL